MIRSSPPIAAGPPIRPGAIAALLTPAGRGALAVVGIRGPAATQAVARYFHPRGGPLGEWPIGRIGLGRWRTGEAGNVSPEDVVAVRTDGGWEIHCHGGVAASSAVLADLRRIGAEVTTAEEWAACGTGSVAADALATHARVRGPRAARILARQQAGCLERAFADIEALLLRGDRAEAESRAARLFAAGRFGLRLDRPWRVAVVGEVNVGKSSLVNALAGHARSIVSPFAGTTRDAVETTLVLGGWEVVIVDTAGTPDRSGRIPGATERAGIERAAEQRRGADLVLLVVEAGTRPAPTDDLVVWSKADLAPGAVAPAGVIRTAATLGTGIDELTTAIGRRLFPDLAADPALLDGAVPFLERHLDRLREMLGWDGAVPDESRPRHDAQ